MKHTGSITMLLLMFLSLQTAARELQRLSIRHGQTISITKNKPGNLSTIGIDYYRDLPGLADTESRFNRVYSDNGIVIKINGKKTDRTFHSLVESDNPLLLLPTPKSVNNIDIALNHANQESKSIRSIDIEFTSHAEVGNLINDRDVTQAAVILKNYGQDISQIDYWKRAMCIDLLPKNKIITFDEQTRAIVDKLFSKLDLSLFLGGHGNDFKYLVDNNMLTLDDQGNLVPKSVDNLAQTGYYRNAIESGKRFNDEYKCLITPDCPDHLPIRESFYDQRHNLIDPTENANTTTDTPGGYILMIAWKAESFEKGPYMIRKEGKEYYKADDQFFKYALFMANAAQMKKWCGTHHITSLSSSERRTRLMQLLGLPPSSNNNLFVEFWVKKEDMFRPAVDSSLTLANPLHKLDDGYLKSFAGFSRGSYSNENLFSNYPFTGQGYTWDWSPTSKDHVGLNEFVLKEGRIIQIRRTLSTDQYLNSLE